IEEEKCTLRTSGAQRNGLALDVAVLIFAENSGRAFNRWIAEKRRNGELVIERLTNLVDQPSCLQRMAAQGEEIIANANLFETQNLAPNLRESFFYRRAGGNVSGFRSRSI